MASAVALSFFSMSAARLFERLVQLERLIPSSIDSAC